MSGHEENKKGWKEELEDLNRKQERQGREDAVAGRPPVHMTRAYVKGYEDGLKKGGRLYNLSTENR